jgi:hypothetical protein
MTKQERYRYVQDAEEFERGDLYRKEEEEEECEYEQRAMKGVLY